MTHPTHPSEIAPLWIADGKQIRPNISLFIRSMIQIGDRWMSRTAAVQEYTYPCTLKPGEYPAEELRFVWEIKAKNDKTLPAQEWTEISHTQYGFHNSDIYDTRRSIRGK